MEQNQEIYDRWSDYLYETAERVDDDLSQRDFCFEAESFLSEYSLETRLYCWKRLVIEQQAEIDSGFDGCLQFPIPALFYEYAPKQVRYLNALAELNKSTGLETDETDSEYDPAKRGLTRQFAMMLLDDLFPNLKNASASAKAEFMALLTGWNADGLRNKWSDYRLGNTELLQADRVKVSEWKKKLKIEK